METGSNYQLSTNFDLTLRLHISNFKCRLASRGQGYCFIRVKDLALRFKLAVPQVDGGSLRLWPGGHALTCTTSVGMSGIC